MVGLSGVIVKDFQVSKYNIDVYFEMLLNELERDDLLLCNSQPPSVGKWGLARLWRVWMATTAEYMAKNGVTMPLMVNADGVTYSSRPFNADDAHELFTRQHMGADELGRRLSWAKSIKKDNENKERVATKGERFNALRSHEDWSSTRGITLFKPRSGEYKNLTDEQDD